MGKRKPLSKKAQHKLFLDQLDSSALRLQSNPDDEGAFQLIHAALHQFIMGQAFHRFIIRGQEGKDLYQESLIVLWQKAIPNFDPTRGMRFFGFAKMCINRHLITILNSALNRKKDMPMNRAVSLDQSFGDSDGDDECSLSNLLDDGSDFVSDMCQSEESEITTDVLMSTLSPFEASVLKFYLDGLTYKEISGEASDQMGRPCNEKSVDNALLRVRRKAAELLGDSNPLPLFS